MMVDDGHTLATGNLSDNLPGSSPLCDLDQLLALKMIPSGDLTAWLVAPLWLDGLPIGNGTPWHNQPGTRS